MVSKANKKRRTAKRGGVFTMRRFKKCPKSLKIAVVLVVLLVVAAIVFTIYSHTPLQQARDDLKRAQESESRGETAAAIAHYKDSLRGYQTAGDKAGEEGVKLQIRYLESLPK